jgi:hypothetical protein
MAEGGSNFDKALDETFDNISNTGDKKKKTLDIIVSSIVVILLIMNIICIHTFKRTLISWASFANYSVLFSIPFMIFAFIMASKSTMHKEKQLGAKAAIGVIAGFVIYLICASFIPFGYNYYWSEQGEKFSTSNFEVIEVTTTRKKNGSRSESVSYEYEFKHEDYEFDFRESDFYHATSIEYYISEGPLGFTVIKDWKLK